MAANPQLRHVLGAIPSVDNVGTAAPGAGAVTSTAGAPSDTQEERLKLTTGGKRKKSDAEVSVSATKKRKAPAPPLNEAIAESASAAGPSTANKAPAKRKATLATEGSAAKKAKVAEEGASLASRRSVRGPKYVNRRSGRVLY